MEIYAGCLGGLVQQKGAEATEFARKIAELDRQFDQMMGELLGKLPTELRLWLRDDGILSSLKTYGISDTKLYLGGEYGFTSMADVRRKIKIIEKTWKGIVTIEIYTPEPHHRVEVKFRLVHH